VSALEFIPNIEIVFVLPRQGDFVTPATNRVFAMEKGERLAVYVPSLAVVQMMVVAHADDYTDYTNKVKN
jgi:hypothetical protein